MGASSPAAQQSQSANSGSPRTGIDIWGDLLSRLGCHVSTQGFTGSGVSLQAKIIQSRVTIKKVVEGLIHDHRLSLGSGKELPGGLQKDGTQGIRRWDLDNLRVC